MVGACIWLTRRQRRSQALAGDLCVRKEQTFALCCGHTCQAGCGCRSRSKASAQGCHRATSMLRTVFVTTLGTKRQACMLVGAGAA